MKLSRAQGLLFLGAALLVCLSCGRTSSKVNVTGELEPSAEVMDPEVLEAYEQLKPDFEFDSQMTPVEKYRIKFGIVLLSQFEFDQNPIGKFEQVFGGPGSDASLKYLAERVRLLVSYRTNVEQSTRVLAPQATEAQRVATNLGIAMWMIYESRKPDQVVFRVGNRLIEPVSSRVGVVRSEEAFGKFHPIVGGVTLLHEGRHSDCTGGLDRSELERIKGSELPVNKVCGHLHAKCVGGTYAGLSACDDHPWGAYSVGAVYALNLAKRCQNCTEKARTVAMAMAIDSSSRLNSGKSLLNDSTPDMTSQGVNP